MKTSNKLLLAFLCFVLLLLISFILIGRSNIKPVTWILPSGQLKKEVIDPDHFHQLSVNYGVDIMLVPDRETIEIEADENYLPFVDQQVEDGSLSVGLRSGTRIKDDNLHLL